MPRTPTGCARWSQTFASVNPARFHDPSGAGYRFLADQILAVDALQPDDRGPADGAARRLGALQAGARGDLMREQLARIAAAPNLSKNVYELASRALGDSRV